MNTATITMVLDFENLNPYRADAIADDLPSFDNTKP